MTLLTHQSVFVRYLCVTYIQIHSCCCRLQITGSLHVVEDERIETERRDLDELEKWSATLQQYSSNKTTTNIGKRKASDSAHTESSSDSLSSDEETRQAKLAKGKLHSITQSCR